MIPVLKQLIFCITTEKLAEEVLCREKIGTFKHTNITTYIVTQINQQTLQHVIYVKYNSISKIHQSLTKNVLDAVYGTDKKQVEGKILNAVLQRLHKMSHLNQISLTSSNKVICKSIECPVMPIPICSTHGWARMEGALKRSMLANAEKRMTNSGNINCNHGQLQLLH